MLNLKIWVEGRRHHIILDGTNDAALQTIRMDDVSHPMHNHSPTSLFSPLLVPVLGVHLLEGKVAILVFKTTVVQGEQFAEDLAFYLFHEVVYGVAVDECPLFCVVGMQVEIKR